MLLRSRENGVLRAWVPGCSTGEEVFSRAMVFTEALESAKLRDKISLQIFATDLYKAAIEKARAGVYPASISADVSPVRLKRFFVSDNGPGIEAEYFEKIFIIFQTLQERDAFESTGVGLAIVKRIIEENKGTIKVESSIGKGTTFVFTWPKQFIIT